MSPHTSTTASCARPCGTPPTLDRALAEIVAEADATGVGLNVCLDATEIWVLDITRSRTGHPGAGRQALEKLQRLASERGLTIGLAFWACNSALRAYYEALGFEVVEEPDDLESDEDHAVARWRPTTSPTPT